MDVQTSHDMIVQEGDNVTLRCNAVGSPSPTIEWRREKGKPLLSVGSKESKLIEIEVYLWLRSFKQTI